MNGGNTVKLKLKEVKMGPLETLILTNHDHCQMCGAKTRLEPAFTPDDKPAILCFDCRIGSAELLHDRRKAVKL